jgi:hypothetical protein
MQIRFLALAALLLAAFTSAVSAQQANAVTTVAPKAPAGVSLAFDAAHGQITASGFALRPVPMDTSTTPTTGTVQITVNVNLVTHFKAGTRIKCGALVLGGEIDTATYTINGGMETAVAKAWVTSPSTAVCKLAIPYSWTLSGANSPATGMIVGFAVAAVEGDGDTVRSTTQLSGVDNLPATGATSKYTFNAAL